MKTLNNAASMAALIFVAACSFASTDAAAVQREKFGNATAFCQAANPVSDAAIRRRPLALQNEGTANVFVSCSFVTDTGYGGSAGTDGFQLIVTNTTGTPKTASCTGIVGTVSNGALYFPSSVEIAANSTTYFTFTGGEEGPFDSYAAINASCVLPPGVSIDDTYVWYKVDEVDATR
jgi:hypothetical protein